MKLRPITLGAWLAGALNVFTLIVVALIMRLISSSGPAWELTIAAWALRIAIGLSGLWVVIGIVSWGVWVRRKRVV